MKKLILLLFIPLVFTCSSDSSDDDSIFEPDYEIMNEIACDWRANVIGQCRLILNGYEQDDPNQLGTGVYYNGDYQANIEWLADDSEIHITIINENFETSTLYDCPAIITEVMSYDYSINPGDGSANLTLTTSENETITFGCG